MNPVVVTSYQLPYLLLSFGIALVGSFVALTAATRIRRANGSLSWSNTIAAGVALGGIGVWSMHFIGMVALRMDIATAYSGVETAVSLVAAIAATAMAMAYVARAPERLGRIAGAGIVLGMGVVVMHYLGMFGIRLGGYIQWDYALVTASVAIAVVAATAALWLAFNTRTVGLRMSAALLMAVAVCSMHYTGMTAATFVCTTANRNAVPQGFLYFGAMDLSSVVAAVAFGLALVISIDQIFQHFIVVAHRPARTRNAASRALSR